MLCTEPLLTHGLALGFSWAGWQGTVEYPEEPHHPTGLAAHDVVPSRENNFGQGQPQAVRQTEAGIQRCGMSN